MVNGDSARSILGIPPLYKGYNQGYTCIMGMPLVLFRLQTYEEMVK